MKKVLAAVLLSAAVTTPALAGDLPVYGGVSLGSSSLGNSSSGTAVGFFAGYKLNKSQTPFMGDKGSLAIEGHYTTLGSDTYSSGFGGSTFSVTAKYSSIGVDAVALFPIASVQHLSAFGKLGFASTSASISCSGTGAFAGVGCAGVADPSTTGLVYGLGVQYDVDSKIGVRAGYQSYASDASTIYAAALYNF